MFEELKKNIDSTEMVDSKLISQILAAIDRYVWLRWKIRQDVKQAAAEYVEVGKTRDGRPKTKKMYRCQQCQGLDVKVHVDHVEPRLDPAKGFEGFDTYVHRTFCHHTKLRVLCVPCHEQITENQNKVRRERRRLTSK